MQAACRHRWVWQGMSAVKTSIVNCIHRIMVVVQATPASRGGSSGGVVDPSPACALLLALVRSSLYCICN
jgi:hypothetical protein